MNKPASHTDNTGDQIFRAISDHIEAIRAADVANEDCALNMVPGFRTLEEQIPVSRAAYAAFCDQLAAARALGVTVPTSEAGALAFEQHMSVERYRAEVEIGREVVAYWGKSRAAM
jgi:hypothetical protein